jgi:hypothetical protein
MTEREDSAGGMSNRAVDTPDEEIPMRTLSLLIAVLLAALAVPATASTSDPCADEDGTITYSPEQVWFHEGESKVGNLADRGDQAPAPFDTTEPTRSVQSGAGAGAFSNGGSVADLAPGAENSVQFAGQFEGCIDTLLVEMYAFEPTNRTGTSASLAESPHVFGGSLTIDGKTIALPGPIEAQTIANPGGDASYRIRFAITDIRNRTDRLGLDPTGLHEIGLELTAWFVNTNNTVYVWDTTEVPSGMTFNGEVDDTYTRVKA